MVIIKYILFIRIGGQVHFEIRKQLVAHIKQKMHEDYQAFGGERGVSEYYYTALHNNKDMLIELLLQNVDLSKINEKDSKIRYTDCNGKEREIRIVCDTDKTVFTLKGLLNTLKTDNMWVRKDDLNKKTVNLYFNYECQLGFSKSGFKKGCGLYMIFSGDKIIK